MNDTKIIKIITPSICPHCGKKIIVSSQMVSPIIDWILRKEDVDKAKVDLKEKVKKIDFKDKEEKKAVLSWIDNENTLIGPAEVPKILEQIQEEEKDKKT